MSIIRKILVHTITSENVRHPFSMNTALRCGIRDSIGKLQQQDIGKRVYKVGSDESGWIYQTESNEQRDSRLQS